jgi:hypothetical protein
MNQSFNLTIENTVLRKTEELVGLEKDSGALSWLIGQCFSL